MSPAATELFPAGSTDVLYLVDLSGYVFRAYHAMPPLETSSGEPTGAIYGTLNMIHRLIADRQPAYLAVAMDTPGKGFRAEIDPDYKANRPPAPPELHSQLVRCQEIFEAWGVPTYLREDFEADDLIATVTRRARAAGLKVVIATGDKDLLQLVVEDEVLCWDAMRSRVFGPAEVRAKWGVGPEQVRALLALVGDSSDNVKGVRGVGPKTAAKLLAAHGSLDAIFEHLDEIARPKLRQALTEQQPAARLAYQLVGLRDDLEVVLDLDKLGRGGADTERLRALFTELELQRFIRIAEGAAPSRSEATAPEAPDETHGDTSPPSKPSEAGTPTSSRIISTVAGLTGIADRARAAGRLVITALAPPGEAMRAPLTGIAMATTAGDAVYLPLGHRNLVAAPPLEATLVRERLGPLLADPQIAKLGHDLKLTQVVLANHELPVRGAEFDSMLASYLLDPEVSHALGAVAERDADLAWTPLHSIAPQRGRAPQPTIEDLEPTQAAPWACAHVEAVMVLSERQAPALRTAGLDRLLAEVEMPLLDVLTQMELCGVLVATEPLAALGAGMREELGQIEARAIAAAGRELNLASPKQLEAVLFDELGLRATRKTKTGRSTDQQALQAIADDHPLPRLVLEHRSIAKLLGTYVEALPKLVNPATGRIHTRWDQAVTATGRISSKDPNLQNIPVRSKHGKRIREAFVAPPGMVLLSADYSQIELRVMAHLAADPKLVEAFHSGDDIHVRTAMEIFGVARDEVTAEMRAQSKTVNYAVIYGMGAVALGKRLGIARKEAKRFIEAYFERYSGVRALFDRTLEEARRSKEVHTLLGRRRKLAAIESKSHAQRAYAERIAQNTPIQGTAADLLKLAMIALSEPVVPGAHMVLTVHDELVFEIPAERVEEATARVKHTMEGIFPLDVPLLVDIGTGPHWAAAH